MNCLFYIYMYIYIYIHTDENNFSTGESFSDQTFTSKCLYAYKASNVIGFHFQGQLLTIYSLLFIFRAHHVNMLITNLTNTTKNPKVVKGDSFVTGSMTTKYVGITPSQTYSVQNCYCYFQHKFIIYIYIILGYILPKKIHAKINLPNG